MSRANHVRLMASYNGWMNMRLVEAAQQLPPAVLSADKKAFFGSILGTLNHLVNADTIWLKRFAAHPANYGALDPVRALPMPGGLDALLFNDLHSLAEHRRRLDGIITAWAHDIAEPDLDVVLHYANSKGEHDKNFFSLIMHFFNHQTHHRGQLTTLLSQEGVDVGVTDLLALIPNQSQA
jgi:uncharacterized damage-inducible protein DinB